MSGRCVGERANQRKTVCEEREKHVSKSHPTNVCKSSDATSSEGASKSSVRLWYTIEKQQPYVYGMMMKEDERLPMFVQQRYNMFGKRGEFLARGDICATA